MKKLNKLCVLVAGLGLVLTSCGEKISGYAHYSNSKSTLSGLFKVAGTNKTLEETKTAMEASATNGTEDTSTSLSLNEKAFSSQSVVEIFVSSYFGSYPLKFTGYENTTKDVTVTSEDGKETTTETKGMIQFNFNFEKEGNESYKSGLNTHDFFIPVSIEELKNASFVSVLITKEGRSYGGNSAYASYAYQVVEE